MRVGMTSSRHVGERTVRQHNRIKVRYIDGRKQTLHGIVICGKIKWFEFVSLHIDKVGSTYLKPPVTARAFRHTERHSMQPKPEQGHSHELFFSCPKEPKPFSPIFLSKCLHRPIAQLPAPCDCNQHPTNDVDESNNESKKPAPLFADEKEYRLNVVPHEDTRNLPIANRMTLLCYGILIRPDSLRSVCQGTDHRDGFFRWRRGKVPDVGGINGRYDAGIILKFVEVVVGRCASVVERIA